MVKKFLNVALTGIFLVLIPGCGNNKFDPKKPNSHKKSTVNKKQKNNGKKVEAEEVAKTPEDFELLAVECTREFKYKEAADVYAHLEKMCDDPVVKSRAKFNQGKSLFLSGNYEKSSDVLNKFAEDFPESAMANEARYLCLVSKYNCAKKVNLGLDQKALEEVSKLAQSLLTEEAMMPKKVEIAGIVQDCKERMCSKEIEKFELYLRRSDLTSAQSRLCKIKDDYKDLSLDFNARMLYLESKLAKASGEDSAAKDLVMELVNNYPDSRFSKMARSSFDGFFNKLA